MKALGIIPMRGGSKGIPGKNLRPVAGKPLAAYTIEAALASKRLDRTIVSTDSPEIAAVARSLGVEVPFLRPPELARDDTPGITPLVHAIDWLAKNEGEQPDHVVCLQVTSPLRTAEDIDASVKLAQERAADGVVSVTPAAKHPLWMKTIDANGVLHDFSQGQPRVARRQDLPPVYALNGAIFLARPGLLRTANTWYTERTFGYIMPPERSLDIDTPWDLYMADLLLRQGQGGNGLPVGKAGP